MPPAPPARSPPPLPAFTHPHWNKAHHVDNAWEPIARVKKIPLHPPSLSHHHPRHPVLPHFSYEDVARKDPSYDTTPDTIVHAQTFYFNAPMAG